MARFDFTWGDDSFHQEILDNLKIAVKNTKHLRIIMLDSIGPGLKILNESGEFIELKESTVVLTPDKSKVASPDFLPINYSDLSYYVKSGDKIFVSQYLYNGSETTFVWLQVIDTNDPALNCLVKNTATLTGEFFTTVAAGMCIGLPTLSDIDKQAIQTWRVCNQIDFVSLSYICHANDVRLTCGFKSKLGDLKQTHIYAKIENQEGLEHFDEILKEADGIILSCGNLGIDILVERVFVFQKPLLESATMLVNLFLLFV